MKHVGHKRALKSAKAQSKKTVGPNKMPGSSLNLEKGKKASAMAMKKSQPKASGKASGYRITTQAKPQAVQKLNGKA